MIELKRYNIINGQLIEDKNGAMVFYADAEHVIHGIQQQMVLLEWQSKKQTKPSETQSKPHLLPSRGIT